MVPHMYVSTIMHASRVEATNYNASSHVGATYSERALCFGCCRFEFYCCSFFMETK